MACQNIFKEPVARVSRAVPETLLATFAPPPHPISDTQDNPPNTRHSLYSSMKRRMLTFMSKPIQMATVMVDDPP